MTWSSSRNSDSSPTSVKSVCVANNVRLASRLSPSRASAAAAIDIHVPPRQYPTACTRWSGTTADTASRAASMPNVR